MSLKYFIGIEGHDDHDVYQWLSWLTHKTMDCRSCIEINLDHDTIPDCMKCIPNKKLIKKAIDTLEKRRQSNGKRD